MTASLLDLIQQKETLERQIHQAQEHAKAEAVAKVRVLMSEHGLTVDDLTSAPSRKGMNAGLKVAPKYRDPTSGATWSGRGLRPKWLAAAIDAGRALNEFAI
jgi:DNA-binding protein H-NS